MNELDKIIATKSFLEKLANGINPMTNEAVPEGDLLNDVKVSRTLFYVADILERFYLPKKNIKNDEKRPFYLSLEEMNGYKYEEKYKVSITTIVERLNQLIDERITQKIDAKAITTWLVKKGYLVFYKQYNGKINKKPTENGVKLGIYESMFYSSRVLKYGLNAQKFIVENINSISEYAFMVSKNADKSWSEEEDKNLIILFEKVNLLIEDIAIRLDRPVNAVRTRLELFGFEVTDD